MIKFPVRRKFKIGSKYFGVLKKKIIIIKIIFNKEGVSDFLHHKMLLGEGKTEIFAKFWTKMPLKCSLQCNISLEWKTPKMLNQKSANDKCLN